MQSVAVLVDGVNRGTATLGGERPDLQAFFNRSDFNRGGWSFQVAAASLGAGSHTVTALALGPSGSAQLVGSRAITVETGAL